LAGGTLAPLRDEVMEEPGACLPFLDSGYSRSETFKEDSDGSVMGYKGQGLGQKVCEGVVGWRRPWHLSLVGRE